MGKRKKKKSVESFDSSDLLSGDCGMCKHYLTVQDEEATGFCCNDDVPPDQGKFGILKFRKDSDSCDLFQAGKPEVV